ncbi:FadR/GntR family transcriptional regulator [Agromyces seonyuensis]|uniref:FCD domain-containing protein n=1 Tax=Agromyces seonyuensis TaxID=2662446 RepID=A0A6I4P2X8_9MICO|nr:FCD domain-containing protein [Agromyces seonyuensis]MWB98489.1 FCD domain-containing protein [Agromyces seonyuensis]
MPRESLVDAVVAYLRTEIGSGAWPIGSRIPSDAELMAAADAGRNTVREAIQALVQAGMLVRKPSKGTYVTAATPLSDLLESTGRRDVLELRLAVDATAAALAAIRRTDEDADGLRRLLAARAAAFEAADLDERARADTALHAEIVRISGNSFFADIYDSSAGVLHETVLDDVRDEASHRHDDHADLVAAIVAGRRDDASAAVTRILAPLVFGEAARAGAIVPD